MAATRTRITELPNELTLNIDAADAVVSVKINAQVLKWRYAWSTRKLGGVAASLCISHCIDAMASMQCDMHRLAATPAPLCIACRLHLRVLFAVR